MFQDSAPLTIFLAPILYALTLPTIISLIIVNEVVRTIVKFFLWFKRGHGLTLVEDGIDAVFHYKSNGNTRNVTVVCIVDRRSTQFHAEKYAKKFEKQVLFHEELDSSWSLFGTHKRRYRPYEKLEKIITTSYGYYCWKHDDKFDVRRHFRVLDNGKVYTESDIMKMLSTLTLDMDENKPQWEFIFIPRFQNAKGEDKSVQIFNFHHAYLDGLSLMMMLDRHLVDNKVAMQLDPLNIHIPFWKKLSFYINGLVYGPHVFLTLFLNRRKDKWIPNSFDPRGQKVFAWTNSIDMSVLKRIRHKTNATIPNVIAEAFVTALKQTLPKERIMNDSLLWGEILAFVPYTNADPQNRFTLFSYPISTHDLTDSEEEFKKVIVKLKHDRLAAMVGPQPLLYFLSFKLCGRFPYFLFTDLLDLGQTSVCVSNVPSFKDKISFFDSTCEEFCPFPPMPNKTGIMLASISYADHVKVTGAADRTWLTQEEIERIFIALPKIINSIADFGCIPNELPELKRTVLDDEPLTVKVVEKEESVSDVSEPLGHSSSEYDSSKEEEEVSTKENVKISDSGNHLPNGFHQEDDKFEEEQSMDEIEQQDIMSIDNKESQLDKELVATSNLNGSAKFNETNNKTETIQNDD